MCKIWSGETLMSPSAKVDGSEERWDEEKKEGREKKMSIFHKRH